MTADLRGVDRGRHGCIVCHGPSAWMFAGHAPEPWSLGIDDAFRIADVDAMLLFHPPGWFDALRRREIIDADLLTYIHEPMAGTWARAGMDTDRIVPYEVRYFDGPIEDPSPDVVWVSSTHPVSAGIGLMTYMGFTTIDVVGLEVEDDWKALAVVSALEAQAYICAQLGTAVFNVDVDSTIAALPFRTPTHVISEQTIRQHERIALRVPKPALR